ncbi:MULTISPECIES: DUF2986 domain-containing protein [Shewanella]|jgi:predicted neutral ceramidase superfamily lipid hydrolase|uniref:DUF2986 domain-containing protein n=3 Tax=Shewanella putrefaciens TaxID=24 RepID=E6XNY2_SHEP2|nr:MULTISPECIES: DUF2986 domain-containing protein [Shewanella]CAD6367134.1 hypothetical protein SHEWT2_01594 [Shewanella hafniensis]ABM24566.1 conserved hypothetical protein [Shewanella sp. W3-18-1]AVV81986.1 hypothetical protein SPWS13_0115 [Shewanella putrefaciens]MCA1896535.1 DUF2986 domain-containing protein [Shewanella putrefaciens]MCK7629409.1 DUF2986 domain-containing protein [Shewanella sp. JNE9-1]
MNKKQKIIKKIAKRAKARLNKVDPVTIGSPAKSGYISKAERARLEALDVSASSQVAEADCDSNAK